MSPPVTSSGMSRPKVFLDAPRLRTVVYELSRGHARLRLPLLKLAAAGSALAANPTSATSRQEAREAWKQTLDVIEQHMGRREDEDLLENAERLRLLPDVVAKGMLDVCNKLREQEYQLSQIDFEESPPELIARAGEAMRRFAATLDDLAVREDRELLPRLQHLLYQHGVALKR